MGFHHIEITLPPNLVSLLIISSKIFFYDISCFLPSYLKLCIFISCQMTINKFFLQDRKIPHVIMFVLESPGHGETHKGRLAKCLDNAASMLEIRSSSLASSPKRSFGARVSGSVFYGGSDRYGMGAGPDIMWCSGKDYNADMQLGKNRRAH